jgi:hypothetical protein
MNASRRALLAGLLSAPLGVRSQEMRPVQDLTRIDHLIYATPDLDRTVAELELQTGVRASAGGSHPGRGTRNALLALGTRCYLEILGPDPTQPPPERPRTRGIDRLQAAKLVGWAANASDLDRLSQRALAQGVELGAVRPGSRRKPDGELLQWRFTDPNKVLLDGLVPFLIDWGGAAHPALDAARGCSLLELRAEHPDPAAVLRALQALDIRVPVTQAAVPALVARIKSPRGIITLR